MKKKKLIITLIKSPKALQAPTDIRFVLSSDHINLMDKNVSSKRVLFVEHLFKIAAKRDATKVGF
jgi:hypothetical protein